MDSDIAHRIAQDLGITPKEYEQRKNFLQLKSEDVERVRAFAAEVKDLPGIMFDAFYQFMKKFPETRRVLKEQIESRRLKEKLLTYFKELFSGDYGWDYMLSRLRVGWQHGELGIEPSWYTAAYGKCLEALCSVAVENSGEAHAVYGSLLKVVLLDMNLATEAYYYAKYRRQGGLDREVTDGAAPSRKFYEMMIYEIERTRRDKSQLTMLMLSVDRFEEMEQRHGGQQVAQTLKEISREVVAELRQGDVLVPFEEATLVVFLPATGLDAGAKVAERIRHGVEKHLFPVVGRLSIALGAAALRSGEEGQRFLERVRAKTSQALEDGGNQVCW